MSTIDPKAAEHLRFRVDTLTEQLVAAKSALALIEEECLHQWAEPVRYIERGTGVIGNIYWKRTCAECGKEEKTYREQTRAVYVPIFS